MISQGNIVRVTTEQAVWETPKVNPYQRTEIDVGGPFEIIAVRREQNFVNVFDADGNALWQTAGTATAVDPDGDVFVILGAQLEKRAGLDGALLCTIELPAAGRVVTVDEDGFPVVHHGQALTKYTP